MVGLVMVCICWVVVVGQQVAIHQHNNTVTISHQEWEPLDQDIVWYSLYQRLSGEKGNRLVIPEDCPGRCLAYLSSKYHLVEQQLTMVLHHDGHRIYSDDYDTPCTNNIVNIVNQMASPGAFRLLDHSTVQFINDIQIEVHKHHHRLYISISVQFSQGLSALLSKPFLVMPHLSVLYYTTHNITQLQQSTIHHHLYDTTTLNTLIQTMDTPHPRTDHIDNQIKSYSRLSSSFVGDKDYYVFFVNSDVSKPAQSLLLNLPVFIEPIFHQSSFVNLSYPIKVTSVRRLPALIQYQVSLPAVSSLVLRIQVIKKLKNFQDYPNDPQMGHHLAPSVVLLSSGPLLLQSHLIKTPEPDFSMPYNVFCYNLCLYSVLLVAAAKKFM